VWSTKCNLNYLLLTKYDEDFCLETFNKILEVSVARSDMKINYAAWEIYQY